ncbi:hypothetical protein LINPERHAP2_LOCUS29587 [Linum perenne]
MSQSPINEQATFALVGEAEQSSPAPDTAEQTSPVTPAVHNANGTENCFNHYLISEYCVIFNLYAH